MRYRRCEEDAFGRVGTYRDKLRSAFDARAEIYSQALDMTIAQCAEVFIGNRVRRFVTC